MNQSTSNGLSIGDRVIDFRGEATGTIENISVDRGPGKSDKVVVILDGGGRSWNYCSVWRIFDDRRTSR